MIDLKIESIQLRLRATGTNNWSKDTNYFLESDVEAVISYMSHTLYMRTRILVETKWSDARMELYCTTKQFRRFNTQT